MSSPIVPETNTRGYRIETKADACGFWFFNDTEECLSVGTDVCRGGLHGFVDQKPIRPGCDGIAKLTCGNAAVNEIVFDEGNELTRDYHLGEEICLNGKYMGVAVGRGDWDGGAVATQGSRCLRAMCVPRDNSCDEGNCYKGDLNCDTINSVTIQNPENPTGITVSGPWTDGVSMLAALQQHGVSAVSWTTSGAFPIAISTEDGVEVTNIATNC